MTSPACLDQLEAQSLHILRDGVGPQTHGTRVHTGIMKTQALKQALAERVIARLLACSPAP